MGELSRIAIIGEAIKDEIAARFPDTIVTRSYRADIDNESDNLGNPCAPPRITVMIENNAMRGYERREGIDQEISYAIALTKPLKAPENEDGWNEQIDPLILRMEILLEMFSGRRILVEDRTGTLEVTLDRASHSDAMPLYDLEEMIEHQRFLGIVGITSHCSFPFSPFYARG